MLVPNSRRSLSSSSRSLPASSWRFFRSASPASVRAQLIGEGFLLLAQLLADARSMRVRKVASIACWLSTAAALVDLGGLLVLFFLLLGQLLGLLGQLFVPLVHRAGLRLDLAQVAAACS